MYDPIIPDPTDADELQRITSHRRKELAKEFGDLRGMSDAGKLATALNLAASLQAWETVNNATLQRMALALQDAKLLCSCCGLDAKANECYVIGPSNYCCFLCIDEVKERDREAAAEEMRQELVMEDMREHRSSNQPVLS